MVVRVKCEESNHEFWMPEIGDAERLRLQDVKRLSRFCIYCGRAHPFDLSIPPRTDPQPKAMAIVASPSIHPASLAERRARIAMHEGRTEDVVEHLEEWQKESPNASLAERARVFLMAHRTVTADPRAGSRLRERVRDLARGLEGIEEFDPPLAEAVREAVSSSAR